MDLSRLSDPYNVKYGTTSVTIAAYTIDKNAIVTGTGVKSVSYSETPTPYTFRVTAADGVTTKDYTVYIKVADPVPADPVPADPVPADPVPIPRSSDTRMDAIYINGVPLDLNRLSDPYNVSYATTSVNISAYPIDKNAIVTGTGVKSVSYSTNPNPYTIRVTAADGVTTKDYTVYIQAADIPLSSDTSLFAVYIDKFTMDLNRLDNPYNVSYTTTSVNISAYPADTNATVTGTGVKSVPYNTNSNPYTFRVTAADGVTTKDYTVYIKVAGPGKSVTIYYAFCRDGLPQSASYTNTVTDDAKSACAEMYNTLNYPKNFTCTSVRTTLQLPTCEICPGKSCCQPDPNTPTYCTPTGTYAPQYDPCCGTTCPTIFYPGSC
jgi:hypothetical protein